MQGEGRPLDADVKFLLCSFNTPGNEVAPRSDIIGEYFQDRRHGITFSSRLFRGLVFNNSHSCHAWQTGRVITLEMMETASGLGLTGQPIGLGTIY